MNFSDALTIVATSAMSIGITAAGMLAVAKWFGERVADRWLKGVEAKYAQRLATVEANLEHAVTVSRAQFETEFAALKRIWRCVARVRASLGEIETSSAPENETREERLARFFTARSKFNDTVNRLLRAIDDNSAFYPKEIYAAVDEFRLRTKLESSHLDHRKPPFQFERNPPVETPDWYDLRRSAYQEVVDKAELVSGAIRAYLRSIAIRD